LEHNQLFNCHQSAYRKKRSTLDHLIRLHNDINKTINNKGTTVAVFFDFSKAFDMLWKDGLIHKLHNMGINGRIKSWIEDFLSDRKIRVKVNNTLSAEYSLQNGTPQGSVISPVLFLIMINDFPTTMPDTNTSLFADDSSIWRSGRNLQHIIKKLVPDINKIEIWCDNWGFRLNEKKTVAMVFSKNTSHLQQKVPIKINGKLIETVKSVKFLGLTFDQRLTWEKHIGNIVESCKCKINMLRSLTGQHWGTGKRSLLKIYRSLIRPKMEYGIEIFHTASKNAWNKLEVIQHTCLRIACGAMRGTSTDALLQECGEMPLKLRREQALLRYVTKLSSASHNPASSVLQDTWHNHYGKYKVDQGTIFMQVNKFLDLHSIPKVTSYSTASRNRNTLTTDVILQRNISKTENQQTKLRITQEHLQKYKHNLHIYTDASVQLNRQTGAAYYIPSEQTELSTRLQDKTSIITAELIAIKLALQSFHDSKQPLKDISLFTDSHTAIRLLEDANQQ